MKQHTNEIQTSKLIELGFAKPKGWNSKNISSRFVMAVDVDTDNEFNYSIGELIEMLPSTLSPNNDGDCEFHLMLFDDSLYWHVRYTDGDNFCYPSQTIELIDALYDMIVLLKEEGEI